MQQELQAVKTIICPECGATMVPEGGCAYCPACGYSPCK